jgi:peptide deformylase
MKPILLLGNPILRDRCAEVTDFDGEEGKAETADLKSALDAFRKEKGFGRGIAAPQIAIAKRIVAINLGQGTIALFNPKITWRSGKTFTMWDDCMSFPDLLVRLERDESVSVEYQDESGLPKRWERLARPEAELLQHELDHLDGILAVDRAENAGDIIYRAEFERAREFHQRRVDYVIGKRGGEAE